MKIPRKVSVFFSFAIVIAVLVLPFVIHPNKNTKSAASVERTGRKISYNYPAMIGNQPLSIAVVRSDFDHQLGLSGTDKLEYDQGMLFVFKNPITPSFWMKDMDYPLDIIWIDETNMIVSVNQNLAPETYPKQFSPKIPVKYALEVQGGFFASRNLHIGDMLSF